jgi:hypothetical protein
VLRSRDEAEGSEAASVVGLTPADWLLENARVLTLDPARPVAAGLAISGGRVSAIGDASDLRTHVGPRTERFDCRGATVLPGLIDPHLHLFALAARRAHLDCAASASVAALLDRVATRAAALPAGEWVRGDGLDEHRLGRLPGAAELEAAAPGRLVRLRHRSRHASVLSRSALRRLQGRRGVDVATGLVSGREQELSRLVGPLPADVFAAGLVGAGRELAARGVTAVADATPRSFVELAPLRAVAARFPLRVFAMRRPGSRAWAGSERLRPGPVKIMVEEGPDGLRPRPATLARLVARGAAAGDQLAIHCVGVATLIAALDAFAALPACLRRRRRHRLEHVAECPPPLVGPLAALGLTVVTNPAFVALRGDVYAEESARGAVGWLYRARSLAAAGVPLAGASDAPVVPADPWLGVAAARTRRTAGGRVLGGRERLDAGRALALFTTGAADALEAAALGRLAVGGPADLAVVDPDPLRAPPGEVRDAVVRLTLVGGDVAWRA